MKITEVRVKIMEDRSDKLQAFCTITLDDAFVIRDLKIIEGAKGVFVAMPSRKLTDRCPKCGGKNHLRAGFCNECGARLGSDRAPRDEQGRAKLHADIAHPINSASREALQKTVLDAYRGEVERSKQPGYIAPKLYEDDYDYEEEFDETPRGGIRVAPPSGGPGRESPVPRQRPPGGGRPMEQRPRLAAPPAPPLMPPPMPVAAPVPVAAPGAPATKPDDFARGLY